MDKKKIKTKVKPSISTETYENINNISDEQFTTDMLEMQIEKTLEHALKKIFVQYNNRIAALEDENIELRKKIREYADNTADLEKTIEEKVNERVTGMKIKLSTDSVVRAVEQVFNEHPELISDIVNDKPVDNSKIKDTFFKKLNVDDENKNDNAILELLHDLLKNDTIKTYPLSSEELESLLHKIKSSNIAKQKTAACDDNKNPYYNISDDYLEGSFKFLRDLFNE